MASVWGELKRRNVVKVAVAYAIVGWLLVQVADTFFPALQLPEWTVTFVAGLVILGFPLALLLSWAYELTPDGVERTKSVPLSESIAKVTGRKLDFVIIGLMAVGIVFLVVDNYVLNTAGPIADANVDPASLDSLDETASTATEGAAEPSSAIVEEEEREVLPNSVAVLPFDNVSPDPDDAYIATGIHAEILNQLTKLSALNVIARTSMQQYANTEKTIPEIASELNVETVMGGSVRYANGQIRITIQLNDGITGADLWAETYTRDFMDIFAIELDVAMNVADELEAEFSLAEQARIEKAPTNSTEAQLYYLSAISNFSSSSFEDHIDEAIQLDPEFAAAYAVRAYRAAVNVMWIFGEGICTVEECERIAREDAQRAIQLDPALGIAYAALGVLHSAYRSAQEAEDAFRQALEFSPNDAGVLLEFGRFKRFQGDFDEAIRLHRRAAALDPNVFSGHHALGLSYRYARLYDEAAVAFQRSLDVVPESVPDLVNLALVETRRGNHAEAIQRLNQVSALTAWNELPPFRLAQMAESYALLDRADDVMALFQTLQELDAQRTVGNAIWASFHISLNQPAEALQRLEASARATDPGDAATLAGLAANSMRNPILEEPEFREILEDLWESD